MPVLPNPRHEAFAQAILAGLLNSSRQTFSNGRAYQRAGYLAKDAGKSGGSAEAAASRLLKKVKPILDRVRELQAELAKHTAESREKCVAELNELRRDAHAEKAYGAAVSAVMGKAKILNFITDQVDVNQQVDFNSTQSMSDIGRKLLQSIGFKEPDDVSIQAAIELNDTFIDGLQQIHQRAQGFTLDQDEE
jgi:Terminase small subunit